MKLTFDTTLERKLKLIMAPFRAPEAWKSLGLSFAPVPSAILLLQGKPGTGKTTTAEYLGRCLGYTKLNPVPRCSFGDIASAHLGESESKIKVAFEGEPRALFLEEVDAIAWDRSLLSEDTMYMLGIVNTLLIEVDRFIARGGLLVMATNFGTLIDKALLSRVTDTIELHPPVGAFAEKMWKSKLPRPPHADKLTPGQLRELSMLGLTPREMEHAILRGARIAFSEDRPVTFADYLDL